MASIAHDCPRCKSKNSAFIILDEQFSQVINNVWDIMIRCGVCNDVALASLLNMQPNVDTRSPTKLAQSKPIFERFCILRFYPEVEKSDVPDDMPDNVKSAYLEAESSFQNGLYSGAGACYRKAIERAVKNLLPDGKGMLNSRIKEIEKKGLLPPTMISLLDRVRIFGNQSVHEEDIDPTKEECDLARQFSMLFLTYSYSLPAKISATENPLASA